MIQEGIFDRSLYEFATLNSNHFIIRKISDSKEQKRLSRAETWDISTDADALQITLKSDGLEYVMTNYTNLTQKNNDLAFINSQLVSVGSQTVDVNVETVSNLSAPFNYKAVTNSLTTVMDANPSRKMFSIFVKSGQVWLRVGGDASVNGNESILLKPNNTIKSSLICETDIITAITASGTAKLIIQEA